MWSGTPEALGQGNWGTPRFSAPLPPCTESAEGKHKELQDLAKDVDFHPSLLLWTFSQKNSQLHFHNPHKRCQKGHRVRLCPGNQLVLK